MSKLITQELIQCSERSVLCWLATVGADNIPNASPKEMFVFNNDKLLIAHIASPQSIDNIKVNTTVCVSFLDIFVQKGYKLKGQATIIGKEHKDFATKAKILTALHGEKFPIQSVIEISVNQVHKIIAPSYFLFPDSTTEQSQILNAMQAYGVQRKD